MSKLRNLSLRGSLIALVLFFTATLVVVGAIAMQQLWSISQKQRAMYTETVMPLRVVVDAARQGATHFRRMYVYIWNTDPKGRQNELRLNEDSEKSVLQARDRLQQEQDPTLRALGGKLADTWTRYKSAVDNVKGLADRNDPTAMAVLHKDSAELHVAVRNLLMEAAKRQEELARLDTEDAAASVERTFWTLTALIVLCALIGGVLGLLLVRSVMRRLGGEPAYAAQIAQEVAKGNLAVRVQRRDGDQTSVLANMEAMRANLARLVSQVRQSSESIATGATQITSGNSDLSQRTEEQAANVEETAASMEEMNAAVKQNLESVQMAASLAGSASAAAARGGEVVGNVVSTMDAISASSRKIVDIIAVIDSIAFQTNILALNAAVEAARAGEQGRGFAVVASEVRALAQRSAGAAKEIKQLISDSVGNVEAGSTLVGEAGNTMNDIVTQVRRVADLIAEIGAAAHEQGQGISQVGDAINQLDQTTQQNAALVEESAAAAHSLNGQAATLVQLVSVFRLADDGAFRPVAQAQPQVQAQPQPRPSIATPREAQPVHPQTGNSQPVPPQPAKPLRALAKPAPTRAAAAEKPAQARRAHPKPAPATTAPLRVPGDRKPAQPNDDWESF
ncbi:methyl-accepting chemotaxis protein [Achromobacter sp. MFA1 R4]|uniref:methyl-accepting chemotaxis protein n=1 Tax=Achromobacter sp. MFA1 R4 TaxID=1881016 RepID=UPI00095383A3|nr:methyl-accepting chemotaxis protein [Achromobacter sp. MFA1 R4]SIT10546.1 methyl-accepting chemotaxis protein [Achromobacter sp. MFA1 R4]